MRSPAYHTDIAFKYLFLSILSPIFPAVLILEFSPKTARQRQAVFGLQSGEFAPDGRELSALKLILRIAANISKALDFVCAARTQNQGL